MPRWTAALLLLAIASLSAVADEPAYPIVQAGTLLHFPADHSAHPDFRTEWWYVTGWLRTENGRDLGFQVTFFRTRPSIDQGNPSAFAPTQMLFAHAALSDPAVGHLLHDQRIARAGFGLAGASATDTDVVLDRWRLTREQDGRFQATIPADGFSLDLGFQPTQPVLLQGDGGYSRKGPLPSEASQYYSLPHLTVGGTVTENGAATRVTGEAWLDREWSSTYLDPKAVGWDWLGANLDDGGALTVFQIRDAAGHPIWAGGSFRDAGGTLTTFAPGDVSLQTVRNWQSPRTGTLYPVERIVTATIGGQQRIWHVKPLFDDQELDSRHAGGPVYWEGAASLEGGKAYLELTGYTDPLKM